MGFLHGWNESGFEGVDFGMDSRTARTYGGSPVCLDSDGLSLQFGFNKSMKL